MTNFEQLKSNDASENNDYQNRVVDDVDFSQFKSQEYFPTTSLPEGFTSGDTLLAQLEVSAAE